MQLSLDAFVFKTLAVSSTFCVEMNLHVLYTCKWHSCNSSSSGKQDLLANPTSKINDGRGQ
jgi:hypothetical protein